MEKCKTIHIDPWSLEAGIAAVVFPRRMPGMFGKPDIALTFDPKDMETIFRNDGQWPVRRSIETFQYYRTKVRPDIFKKGAGLVNDQGEAWAKLRTAANPIMMKPKVVKAYIPDIDSVAQDFIKKMVLLRDEKNELPDDFQNELNKWSLESIALIALEQRLGLINRFEDPENQKMINAVKDFFTLSYELDIQPSIWRYYKTPKFNRLMESLEVMTNEFDPTDAVQLWMSQKKRNPCERIVNSKQQEWFRGVFSES
ncbi:putative cytochrome P450 12b2, mitochondrial, partial [Pseudolycoriella hygida]